VLRQLARLTRPVPAAGPRALAVAVYSDSDGVTFAARESGSEGVACVDDAARALVLLTDLWEATGNQHLKTWAEGLLEFLLFMHDGAGGWVNFIHSWEGDRNAAGLTSVAGSNFWQARATAALASAVARLGCLQARPALEAAFGLAAESSPPPNVRALHVLAAVELRRHGLDPWLAGRLEGWCEELCLRREGDTLMNSPDERGRPHLWGHVQEAALADASSLLERPDLLDAARRSAGAVFRAAIESGFEEPHVQPYDVQTAVFVMDRLRAATGDRRYAELAGTARAWFGGRNPAGVPTYDRDRGRVADGIDDGVVNGHSGAEANISGGLALLNDPFVITQAATWSGAALGGGEPWRSSRR
jgi:hypothetical protein